MLNVNDLEVGMQILMCHNGHEYDDDDIAKDGDRFYASPFAMYFMLQGEALETANELTAAQFNAVCSFLNQDYNNCVDDDDELPYLSPSKLNDFFASSSLVWEVAEDCEDY